MTNSPGVSAVAGLLLGSICMLLRALLVIRQFDGLGDVVWALDVSRSARGEVDVLVVGLGVTVFSDSSVSLTNWLLPLHIRSTIGGFEWSLLSLRSELRRLAGRCGVTAWEFFEAKNFLGVEFALVALQTAFSLFKIYFCFGLKSSTFRWSHERCELFLKHFRSFWLATGNWRNYC